jgi:hypothetical protein
MVLGIAREHGRRLLTIAPDELSLSLSRCRSRSRSRSRSAGREGPPKVECGLEQGSGKRTSRSFHIQMRFRLGKLLDSEFRRKEAFWLPKG